MNTKIKFNIQKDGYEEFIWCFTVQTVATTLLMSLYELYNIE